MSNCPCGPAGFGRGLAMVQNGQTQTYVLVMALGAVVAVAAILVWV